MKRYIIAIDEGTTSARAAIYDLQQNKFIYIVNKPFRQIYSKSGWVEQNLNEIYAAQISALSEAVILSKIDVNEILSMGITNQRETVAVWDKTTGEPICNAIVWQCRRTAEHCERLISEGYSELIADKTGLVIDAYFSATKIRWVIDNVPKAKELLNVGKLAVGTIDTYLIYRLTNGKSFVTDYTNASRTMLFNIHTLSWDEELLKLFDIPIEILPKALPSDTCAGETNVLGRLIPVCGFAGDQQCALFGQGCFKTGMAKNTYGTGCFMLLNTGEQPVTSKNHLLTTIGIAAKGIINYALEGSVFSAGSAVQWLRDEMGILSDVKESEAFAKKVDSSNGTFFVPAFNGLGAPYWNMNARGALLGISRNTNKYHIVRAVLESIAFSAADVVREMEKDSGIKVKELRCDGGAGKNDFLMQFQADILGVPVHRAVCIESTALGAVFLSGLTMGAFSDFNSIEKCLTKEKVFSPNMSAKLRKELSKNWKRAVERSLNWIE